MCKLLRFHYTKFGVFSLFFPKLKKRNFWGLIKEGLTLFGEGRINPIQAGVLLEPYRLGGGHYAPPLFLLCLLSNYHQTWHGSTIVQNL